MNKKKVINLSGIKSSLSAYIDELAERYEALASVKEPILIAYLCLEECFKNGGKLIAAGNGGSAADAEHIVGELMKGFKKKRALSSEFSARLAQIDPLRGKELSEKLQEALESISLGGGIALSTAFLNDVDGLLVYAQQLYGYGKPQDVFLAISTSGNSKNIIYAAITAKAKGMKVIALTGAGGGELKELADITIAVPETETYKVQELHLPVYHCLCLMLEERFFEKEGL